MVNLEVIPRKKEFNALLELYPPKPANKFLPDWYKKQKVLKRFDIYNTNYTLDAKRCPAIVQELTTGIVIPSWSDFYIWKNKKGVFWECLLGDFNGDLNNFTWIESQSEKQITGMGLNSIANFGIFKLISPYYFKTTKGYGLKFKDPFYHHRNDVRLLPGYVETDIWYETNFPFEFLTNIDKIDEFKIMIKAGDPLLIIEPYSKNLEINLKLNNYDEQFYKDQKKNSILLNSLSEDWNRYKNTVK